MLTFLGAQVRGDDPQPEGRAEAAREGEATGCKRDAQEPGGPGADHAEKQGAPGRGPETLKRIDYVV